jgi:hypothetical protein
MVPRMGYGDDKATDEDVAFEYRLALDAARDLYALAGHVRRVGADRQTHAATARNEWTGPLRERFDQRLNQERSDTVTVADALMGTAGALARSWARARGRQDRINTARFVRCGPDPDGALGNTWTWLGNDDHGLPPEDPPVPQPPLYEPTRQPIHPEHEHR